MTRRYAVCSPLPITALMCIVLIWMVAGCQQQTDSDKAVDTADLDEWVQDLESDTESSLPAGEIGQQSPAGPIQGVQDSTEAASPIAGIKPAEGEINYTSEEGKFTVIWPPGCAQIRNRIRYVDSFNDQVEVALIFCDRSGREQEGCEISAYLAARGPDGGLPTPELASSYVNKTLDTFQVNIVQQRVLRVDMMEGLDVQAVDANGVGEVWIRALLVGERIYIITAWKRSGQLFSNRTYERFFDSFRPVFE